MDQPPAWTAHQEAHARSAPNRPEEPRGSAPCRSRHATRTLADRHPCHPVDDAHEAGAKMTKLLQRQRHLRTRPIRSLLRRAQRHAHHVAAPPGAGKVTETSDYFGEDRAGGAGACRALHRCVRSHLTTRLRRARRSPIRRPVFVDDGSRPTRSPIREPSLSARPAVASRKRRSWAPRSVVGGGSSRCAERVLALALVGLGIDDHGGPNRPREEENCSRAWRRRTWCKPERRLLGCGIPGAPWTRSIQRFASWP